MTMLRPLFVTGSLVHGGAERHSITVMNRLADRGHECHAIYVKDDPSQLDRIHLPVDGTVSCLHAARYLDRGAVVEFAERLVSIEPTVIVAANGYALMYASLALLLARLSIPLVVTFHTTALFGAKEQIKMLTDRFFFWGADCAVFVCENQRRYWQRRIVCSRRNEVIHNGVDSDHFRPTVSVEERHALRQQAGFAATDYVIGISAVLRPEKNHGQLVEALAALRGQGLPAKLLMIGDGPMREAVESRARELKIDEHIRITGFQQDVRPSIALCDVMVLCSITETFSLAALEAMAMAKPVVMSAVGGAAEMITPGVNGYLFPVGDTAALVNRLAALASHATAQAMGLAARRIVISQFSEVTMIDRYETLLQSITAAQTRPEIARQPSSFAISEGLIKPQHSTQDSTPLSTPLSPTINPEVPHHEARRDRI